MLVRCRWAGRRARSRHQTRQTVQQTGHQTGHQTTSFNIVRQLSSLSQLLDSFHVDLPAPSKSGTVAVGISGGVDSSVVAWVLKAKGYNTIGVHMTNWMEEEASTECSNDIDARDAERVCNHLNIPFHRLYLHREYWQSVFEPTVAGYAQGITPNPDVMCNRYIKFDALMQRLCQFDDARWLATGHYAGLRRANDRTTLVRGADPKKDQSYFLCTVREEAFARTVFPLSSVTKTQVRELAAAAGLPTAQKRDSVGLCFVGKRRNFGQFLHRYVDDMPGEYVSEDGTVLAPCPSVAWLTVGQRAKYTSLPEPYFVAAKDMAHRRVTIVEKESPALRAQQLLVKTVEWRDDAMPPSVDSGEEGYRLDCQIRYRSPAVRAVVHSTGSGLLVTFDESVYAPCQGQVVAFYRSDECLGGGVIVPLAPVAPS